MKKKIILTVLFSASLMLSFVSQAANQMHGKKVQRNVASHSSDSYQRSNGHRSVNNVYAGYSAPVRYSNVQQSSYRSNGHRQSYYPAHSYRRISYANTPVHSAYYGRYYGNYNQQGIYQAYDYGGYDQHGVYLAHRHTPHCGHITTPELGALVAGLVIGTVLSH